MQLTQHSAHRRQWKLLQTAVLSCRQEQRILWSALQTWVSRTGNQASLKQVARLCLVALGIHVVYVVGPGRQLRCIQRLHMKVGPPDHILKCFPPGHFLLCDLHLNIFRSVSCNSDKENSESYMSLLLAKRTDMGRRGRLHLVDAPACIKPGLFDVCFWHCRDLCAISCCTINLHGMLDQSLDYGLKAQGWASIQFLSHVKQHIMAEHCKQARHPESQAFFSASYSGEGLLWWSGRHSIMQAPPTVAAPWQSEKVMEVTCMGSASC